VPAGGKRRGAAIADLGGNGGGCVDVEKGGHQSAPDEDGVTLTDRVNDCKHKRRFGHTFDETAPEAHGDTAGIR
jgi:hypothetical protein